MTELNHGHTGGTPSADISTSPQFSAPPFYAGFRGRITDGGAAKDASPMQASQSPSAAVPPYSYYNPYQAAAAAAMYMSHPQMGFPTSHHHHHHHHHHQQQQQQAAAAAAWMAQASTIGTGVSQSSRMAPPPPSVTGSSNHAAPAANPFGADPYSAAATAQMMYMSSPYNLQQYLAAAIAAVAATGAPQLPTPPQQLPQQQQQQVRSGPVPTSAAPPPSLPPPPPPPPAPPGYFPLPTPVNPQQHGGVEQQHQRQHQLQHQQLSPQSKQQGQGGAGFRPRAKAAAPSMPPMNQFLLPGMAASSGSVANLPPPSQAAPMASPVPHAPGNLGELPAAGAAPPSGAAAGSPLLSSTVASLLGAAAATAVAAQPVVPLELNVLSLMPNTRLPAGAPFCPPGVAIPKEYTKPPKSAFVVNGAATQRAADSAAARPGGASSPTAAPPTPAREPVVGSSYAHDIVMKASELLESKKGSVAVTELHEYIQASADVDVAFKECALLDFVETVISGNPARFKVFQYSTGDLERAEAKGIKPNEVRFIAAGTDYKAADEL